jgi:hypothetical protein
MYSLELTQNAVILHKSIDSGLTWVHSDPMSADNGGSFACTNDGSRAILACNGGAIYTLDTSLTTTPITTIGSSSSQYSSIACSSDMSSIVTCVSGGSLYVSTDSGSTWATTEMTQLWTSVATNETGLIMAGVVKNGSIYLSNNSGNTWTPMANVSPSNWNSITMDHAGQTIVASILNEPINLSVNGGQTWSQMQCSCSSVKLSSDGYHLLMCGHDLYTSDLSLQTVCVNQPILTGSQGSLLKLMYLGNNQWIVVDRLN